MLNLGKGPFVGISWKSTNMSPARLLNYAKISDLYPILQLPNLTFINLQYKDFEYDTLFPAIIRQPFNKRFSKANAVSVITNEVMAWETGRQLASLLGIDIDQAKWNKMKNKCLYDYMKWATGVL